MAQYEINGQVYETARELTEDELNRFVSSLGLVEARGKKGAEWLPTAGGVVGGVVGGLVGGVPGAMVGGGAGSAAGEAARQAMTGEETDPGAMIKEYGLGMMGEGAGQMIGRAPSAAVRASKGALGIEKETPQQAFSLAERQAAQQTAQETGSSIPASRMGGGFPQLLEGISRTGLGEGSFVGAEKELGQAFTNEAKSIVDSVSSRPMTDIEVGDALRSTFEQADKAFKDKVAPFYQQIEQLGGNVPIFTDNMANKASQEINKAMQMTRTGRPVGMDEETLRLLKDVSQLKSVLSFSQAHELRSQLLRQQRAMGNKYGPNSEASKILQQQVMDLSKAMDDGASALSPRLQRLYSGVNSEYKRVMKDMYDDVVVKLLNKTPERLGESMARTGNVTEVLRLRKALNQARQQGQPTGMLEENLLQGYLTEITKGLDGSLDNLVTLSEKMKDKKFKRTFNVMMDINPTAKSNLMKIMKAAEISAKDNAPTILQGKGGMGGILNTVAMATAGGAGYAAGGVGGATSVIGGALATQGLLAKLLTSPKTTNIMLSAEKLANKRGVDAALKFLEKSQPFRRWLGQELVRSEVGPKFGE